MRSSLVDHPLFKLGRGVAGRGVRTRRALPGGWIVHRLSGPRISGRQYAGLRPLLRRRCAQVGENTYVGPSGEFDDWFNHSCAPNMYLRAVDGELVLVTARAVRADEELTWDYASVVTDRRTRFACDCGARQCRGLIGRFKDCPLAVRAALARRHAVPSHLPASSYLSLLKRIGGRGVASIPPGMRVAGSQITGLGLFATKAFSAGDQVCLLDGPTHRFLSRTTGDAAAFANWIAVGTNRWIEPEGACRYLNHSCEPNLRIRADRVCLATRRIEPGEEIALDYGQTTPERLWSMECSCGSTRCAGVVTSARWRHEGQPPTQQLQQLAIPTRIVQEVMK